MFTWGELSNRRGVGLELSHFEEHWSVVIKSPVGTAYLHVAASRSDPRDVVDTWGFAWSWESDLRDAVHFAWGGRSKVLRFPWAWDHVRTSYLLRDGVSWGNEKELSATSNDGRRWWNHREDDRLWRETYPYTYRLKSGEVQHPQATVSVDEMEHRWRAFKWCPFPRRIRRWVTVDFDGEVGEGTGSWKGGTLGCGYDLQDGETPEQCLRRMERERVFGR